MAWQHVIYRLAMAGLCAAPWCAQAAAPTPAAAAPATEAAGKKIDIWEFAVDGNTVLDEATINAALQPFAGPDRVPEDVDAARAQLEKTYRDKGYKTVSVSIPRQTVRDGVVVLQVNEVRVEHLNVIGSRYHSIDRIREQAPSLAEGQVPNFNDVKDDIVRLNQQPDRRVTPALKAGSRPGTVDVDLAVSDDLPLHGSLELNNRRSQNTTSLRSMASLSYGNLWQRGHSVSLSYQTAPENTDDARVFFASYLAPVDERFSLLVSGLTSDSNVATVGGTSVLGKGQTLGLRGVWTLPALEKLYQSVTLGVDYKHFRNQVSLSDASFDTPVTYYPVSMGYTALLREGRGSTQMDASLNFASPELGSDTQEIQLNRAYARGQMFYLRAGVTQTYTLPASFEIALRLSGQWTDQPLITNEQMNAGGADSGRGYLEAESLGDYGFTQTLDLRTPNLGEHLALGSLHPVEQFQAFAFFDSSLLRLRQPLPDSAVQTALLSTGLGVSLKLLKFLNGTVTWAVPLDEGTATREDASRWLFRVWGTF